MNKVFFKAYVTKIADNKYRAIASTDAVDRYGDIVDQSGWMLENYLKNPVMLWAHDNSQLPVAKCVGIDRSQAGKMILDFEFNSAAGSPLAPYVQTSYDNGFLNALSVGFIANERSGNVITSAELLEVSFVNVPANQEALRLAMEKGMDLGGIEKDLDLEHKGEVSSELADVEATEAKWQKWDEISEVMSALWSVFFDPKTSPDDFSKLLNETILLLQDVSDNDGADDDEDEVKVFKARMTKFIGGRTVVDNGFDSVSIKAGKTISKKNATVIKACMDHMKLHMGTMEDQMKGHGDHYAALEKMLSASSSSEEGSGKSVDAPAGTLIISKDDMLILRSSVRAADRQHETVLSIVGKFLADKGVAK